MNDVRCILLRRKFISTGKFSVWPSDRCWNHTDSVYSKHLHVGCCFWTPWCQNQTPADNPLLGQSYDSLLCVCVYKCGEFVCTDSHLTSWATEQEKKHLLLIFYYQPAGHFRCLTVRKFKKDCGRHSHTHTPNPEEPQEYFSFRIKVNHKVPEPSCCICGLFHVTMHCGYCSAWFNY